VKKIPIPPYVLFVVVYLQLQPDEEQQRHLFSFLMRSIIKKVPGGRQVAAGHLPIPYVYITQADQSMHLTIDP
jgi:hypothetical protein